MEVTQYEHDLVQSVNEASHDAVVTLNDTMKTNKEENRMVSI